MNLVKNNLLFFFSLPMLALAVFMFSPRAEASALDNAQSRDTLVSASSLALLTGQSTLDTGASDAFQSIARKGGRDHDRWDNDRWDERRDDRRFPKCRRISNHDSKRYRDCVKRNYFKRGYRR
ncbi:MAG: hypothetical protein LBR11_00580 [Deltaproteobacteria bacterium]|nr:hypothetical protein [Deltaproteobacteria bacterium]